MKRIIVILFYCLMISLTISGQDKQAEKLLRDAIYQEEVNGDLNDVIKLYESIVTKFPDNRAVAAKAQLHIGICYEKLGLKEARKAYDKVVNNYPDQKNMVTLAKERLTLLMTLAEKDLETPLVPKFTKINIPNRLGESGALSPDGKKLALTSDKKIWKIPLSGKLGSDFPGIPEQLNTDSVEVPEWSPLSWSQNGKWIAFNNDQSIYVVSSDGGKPRKVIEINRDSEALNYRISLSANGNNLAFSSVEENKQHIFSTPVDKVIPRQLVEMEAREPVFSPDGKYIAFVEDKNKGVGWDNLGLWVIEANGSKPYKLADAGKANSPIWSPDGKLIAFLDGANQICIVPFSKTANTISKVIRIDAPEGASAFISLAGWTHDNKIGAFTRNNVKYGLYTLPVEGGQAAIILHDAIATQPRWSKNGEQIYYVTTPEKWEGRGYNLASVSASGGKGKPLKTNYKGKYINQLTFQSGNRVSPDGKLIVTSTWTQADTNTINVTWPASKIWKVSVDGEDAIQVTNTPGNFFDSSPCWSADGKKIAFVHTELIKKDIFGDSHIYLIDSNGGEPELLDPNAGSFATNSNINLIWSPDGKMIAYPVEKKSTETNILKIIDIESRDIRVIEEFPEINGNTELVWSPDSKRIAFGDEHGKVIKIMNIDDGSIENIETGLPDVRIIGLDWSPDGKRFVFGGRTNRRNEFWFLEDFLPLDKLAQEKEVLPKTTTLQKVKLENVYFGGHAVSPDGKFLTYSGEKDNMAIHEISSGKTRFLTSDATWDEPMQYYMGSVVSPKSKHIAYAWYKNNFEIRLVDVDNPQPKVLYANKDEDVYPCTWSPDGKTIYAKSYLNKTRQCRILAISVSNGEVQVLKTFDGFYWLQLSISPDNKFIAYHYPNYKNGEISDTDIHLISNDGKNETKLFEHPANDQILGWFPNKNQLLFKSNRSGSWDAWVAEVVNGKATGEPKRVLTEIGENASQMGFTQNGTFYYSLMSRKFNGFITPFDQTKGELKSESAKPLLGSVRNAKWSPDGKSFALIKEIWNVNGRPIFIMDAVTGKERMLSDRFNAQHLLWLQDNKRLLILGYDEKRKTEKDYSGGMCTIDVQSGEVTDLLSFSDYRGKDWEIGLLVAQLLAEGNNVQKNIYFLKNGRLICRELASGEEKILLKDQSLYSNNYTLDPLPGEKNLLYCNEDEIYIIPTTGGKQIPIAKAVTTTSGPTVPNSAVWSTDGNYIFYTQNKDDDSVLWQVTPDGKNPTEVWHCNVPINSLSIHPDGQKIVITTLSQGAEIWKVNNLLSNDETEDK